MGPFSDTTGQGVDPRTDVTQTIDPNQVRDESQVTVPFHDALQTIRGRTDSDRMTSNLSALDPFVLVQESFLTEVNGTTDRYAQIPAKANARPKQLRTTPSWSTIDAGHDFGPKHGASRPFLMSA